MKLILLNVDNGLSRIGEIPVRIGIHQHGHGLAPGENCFTFPSVSAFRYDASPQPAHIFRG